MGGWVSGWADARTRITCTDFCICRAEGGGRLSSLFPAAAIGNVEEAESMERALAPLLEEGMLQQLLDLLCLLRLLRSRGAAVVAPWEVLVRATCHTLHCQSL